MLIYKTGFSEKIRVKLIFLKELSYFLVRIKDILFYRFLTGVTDTFTDNIITYGSSTLEHRSFSMFRTIVHISKYRDIDPFF